MVRPGLVGRERRASPEVSHGGGSACDSPPRLSSAPAQVAEAKNPFASAKASLEAGGHPAQTSEDQKPRSRGHATSNPHKVSLPLHRRKRPATLWGSTSERFGVWSSTASSATPTTRTPPSTAGFVGSAPATATPRPRTQEQFAASSTMGVRPAPEAASPDGLPSLFSMTALDEVNGAEAVEGCAQEGFLELTAATPPLDAAPRAMNEAPVLPCLRPLFSATPRQLVQEHAMARLATPRDPGAPTERERRRQLAKDYKAYAQEAAGALVPEADCGPCSGFRAGAGTRPGTVDIWHMEGECGYRSAVFHASVRCRELLQSSGLVEIASGTDGPECAVFQGQASDGTQSNPELVRLHAACFLMEELCKVTSPLQDTLRFVMRELCFCIFDGFSPGSDVLTLTPFYMLAKQIKSDLAQAKQAEEQAEIQRDEHVEHMNGLWNEIAKLRDNYRQLQKRTQQTDGSREAMIEERNQLKAKLASTIDSNELRNEELRELGAEFATLQGDAFMTRRDRDAARSEVVSIRRQLREEQDRTEVLEHRIEDLQVALSLAQDGSALEHTAHQDVPQTAPPQIAPQTSAAGAQASAREGLPPELQKELRLAMERASATGLAKRPGFDKDKGIDGQRFLKVPLVEGGAQIVMRGSKGDERGLQYVGGGGTKGQAPMLIVSGDVFAALSISLALPEAIDILQFGSTEDEDAAVVNEVQKEVMALAQENCILLKLFRQLRQELKETLRLIPSWNADELQGILKSAFVLDDEEAPLVPSPVKASNTFVGLGEGAHVPCFLKYHGVLPNKMMQENQITSYCSDIWTKKTQAYIDAVNNGNPVAGLVAFFDTAYLEKISARRKDQMEFSYNFLSALRNYTTKVNEDCTTSLEVTIWGATGLRTEDETKQECYCICEILGKRRSRIQTAASSVSSSTDPVWNHKAEVVGYSAGDQLHFSVWEADTSRRGKLLGRGELSSDQFQKFDFDGDVLLSEGTKGTSYLQVQARCIVNEPETAPDEKASRKKRRMTVAANSGNNPLHLSRKTEAPNISAATSGPMPSTTKSSAAAGTQPASSEQGGGAGDTPSSPAGFQAGAEVLYRGLLGELHEDVYHDQTAMLAALLHVIVSLGERLSPVHIWQPSDAAESGQDEPSEPADQFLVGLAELSALLRLFFPTKPREHLSSVKKLMTGFVQRGRDSATAHANASAAASAGKGPGAGGGAAAVGNPSRLTQKLGQVDGKGAAVPPALGTPKLGNLPTPSQGPQPQGGGGIRRSIVAPLVQGAAAASTPVSTKGKRVAIAGGSQLDSVEEVEEKQPLPDAPEQDTVPPFVDIEDAFGVKVPPEGIIGAKDAYLADLISSTSPIVVELRRQHVVESMTFLERIHKSFRLAGTDGGTMISVKQADGALQKVDKSLTEDQRRLYLLRGFGRRLPDIPPVSREFQKADGGATANAMDTAARILTDIRLSGTTRASKVMSKLLVREGACAQAMRVQKIRTLLKERAASMFEEGASCPVEDFVRRLASTGVVKGARMWQPDIDLAEAVREVGLINVRSLTATAPLEHFVSAGNDHGASAEEPQWSVQTAALVAAGVEGGAATAKPHGRLEWYRHHAEMGRDLQEVSVGFPGLALSWWAMGIA